MQPAFSPRDTRSELLLPEDEIMLRYRQYLDEWQTKGWHIDLDEVKQRTERQVFTIPSPGRREQKNWVMDNVPLMHG
jgi:hypothetical protein